MSAIVIGLIGLALTVTVGKFLLGMGISVLFKTFAVSELGAFVGMIITLKAARTLIGGKPLIRGPAMNWGLISAIYFAILLPLVPEMRDWLRVLVLFIPLQIGHGFDALAFGPLQDYWVKRRQKSVS